MMQNLNNTLTLINKLNISIKDNKSSLYLVEELLLAFPEYKIRKNAYRAIDGEWEEGHSNCHWSHTYDGALDAFKTCHGNNLTVCVYKAEIEGFDVYAFWCDIQKIEFLKDNLTFTYIDEKEILSSKILSEVMIAEVYEMVEWEEELAI